MSAITLDRIRKTYPGGPQVLHDVSMDIRDGEFIVIVGPSGCGKSTLLRLIAGLESCEQGEIIIAGRRANELAPQDRDIAMIFQNYALYPHMSVRDNIGFGLELRRVPKRERIARAEAVAQTLQLGPYLDRKPGALSGGQRQRVAMGRAMARDSSTFLMDEPLSNLDNALRVEMRTEIKDLHRQLGATIIFVTHDQTEALTLADRIAVMMDGHLLQFDTPEAIYDRPATQAVAAFLGQPPINLLPAMDLPGWQGPSGCVVGLRPETLTVHASRPAGPAIAGRVTLSEMTGAVLVLHCDTDAGRLVVAAPRSALPPGAGPVWITHDPGKALCFDQTTGARIETPVRAPASRVQAANVIA
ncbi:ABC transporter ATP-binding protein [Frigidibacter sp. ROC022]|uniref:ABC transporter ATP-binding protein n=1 Tax=Frigidibacter sp. ROC022 TaxID=2971796 RepID=UPI00215AD865|nr:ATP-binding cassette domain-containing protein [Frigidibacter sp. ROC022]MCR8724980.1 ATP-binding cassette domain-containing protein [Frigidibacter sp. ROC022]